jgi:hypothetical protein
MVLPMNFSTQVEHGKGVIGNHAIHSPWDAQLFGTENPSGNAFGVKRPWIQHSKLILLNE